MNLLKKKAMGKHENILVTTNVQSIHYGTGDYFHLEPHGSESWHDEVMRASAFVDRWMAEQDATILQLIPYIVCMSPSGKVLSYQRKGGGEGRLEGKHSIGIGGHINDLDISIDFDSEQINWQTVINGAIREVTEEIELKDSDVEDKLIEIGTIFTPSDEGGDTSSPGPRVGEVHLGIVYILPINKEILIREDEGMIKPKWINNPPNKNKYERWSQLILNRLSDLRELREKS